MTLSDYYNQLPKATYPKTEFLEKVSKECGVSILTVRNWMRGFSKCNVAIYGEKLEKITGIPKNDLF